MPSKPKSIWFTAFYLFPMQLLRIRWICTWHRQCSILYLASSDENGCWLKGPWLGWDVCWAWRWSSTLLCGLPGSSFWTLPVWGCGSLVLPIIEAAQTLEELRAHELWEDSPFPGVLGGTLQAHPSALCIKSGRHFVTVRCTWKKVNSSLGGKKKKPEEANSQN